MNQSFYEIYEKLKAEDESLSPAEIKSVRRYYKMTQVAFAEVLGVSYHTYKNWEIGHRIPSSPAMALLLVARDYPDVFLKNKQKYINN